MPSFQTKRLGDAPALNRVRELFRKKRAAEGDGQDLRELLKEDRGDLLKELEKLLESQKLRESLAPPSEVHIAPVCCSTSTQTEPTEELVPTNLSAVNGLEKKPSYTSSSTQVEVEKADKGVSVVIAELPSLARSVSPASDVSRSILGKGSVSGNTTEETPEISPNKLPCVPHNLAKCSQASPPPLFSGNAQPSVPSEPFVRRQKREVDTKTGTSWVWNTSSRLWKPKGEEIARPIRVRLPPQIFQEARPLSAERKISAASDSVAPDIRQMRQFLKALANGEDLVPPDDDDVVDGDEEEKAEEEEKEENEAGEEQRKGIIEIKEAQDLKQINFMAAKDSGVFRSFDPRFYADAKFRF